MRDGLEKIDKRLCRRYNNRMKLHVAYWKQSAQRDWNVARDLFQLKHYDGCLFYCHLTLEKALKGLVVLQTGKAAPFSHNLEQLASLAKLALDEEQRKQLQIITTFNVAARYPEEKLALHKKATKRFAEEYLEIVKSLHLWLKKHYPKQ